MKRIFWQWYGVIGIVILVSCSRQEAPQQNTSGSLPAVSNQVQTSETDIAQSGSDQAAGVIMRGFITDANRNPLPVCTLNSQARDISGRPFDREPVASIITMGEDGSYAVSNLTLSYYTFNIEAEGYSPYVTNILLTALDTRVDFVFPALTNIHVTGRVIIAETQEPAERIPVILATTAGGKRQQTVNTDINGRFSFQAPAIIGMPIGTLSVDEPGYVPITCNLEARYRSQEIELYLKRRGVIKGVVHTTDGKPVKGVRVLARPDQPGQSKHRLSLIMNLEKESRQWQTTAIHACNPSDGNGAYSISNVPAPGVYSVDIDSDSYVLASPFLEEEANGDKKLKLHVPDNRDIVCNVPVEPKKVIMIRLLDENREPVSPYKVEVIKEGIYAVKNRKINSTDWTSINIDMSYKYSRLDRPIQMKIRADYWDGRYAEDPDFIWKDGITNQIELMLSTGMFYISGTINYPDAILAPGVEINAGKERVVSDAAGYFAIYGSPVSQDTQVTVKAITGDYLFRLNTNILVGTENVELTFNSLKFVKGRILYGKPPQPATDFKIVPGRNSFRYYDSPNGRFTFNVDPKLPRGTLGFLIPGYSMREISYDVSTNIVCDLGDILFTNAAAGIKGTVVDQNGSPLAMWIQIKCAEKKTEPDWFLPLGLNSNPQDGTFYYADLSPGSFFVEVNGQIMGTDPITTKTETFRLSAGEIKELPPIVINQSNAAMRCLTFILPDGEPAAFARIENGFVYTDDRGQVSLSMRAGRYAGLKATIGKDTYISEPFEIEEDTRELQIQLLPEIVMKGTATCDGETLKRAYVKLYAVNTLSSYSCKVVDGTFEVPAPAGEYIAVDSSKHAFVHVNLEPEQENAIAFETSNGSMKILNPLPGERVGALAFIRIDGQYMFCGMATIRGKEEYFEMNNMPPGQYRIEIKPNFDSTNNDSYTVKTTLGEDEQKTVVLPEK